MNSDGNKNASRIWKFKTQVANVVELKHFDVHKDISIVCDAKHNGLGAVLQQLNSEVSRPISFASHYLKDAKKKYSTNQLEMLAVVLRQSIFAFTYWADHFKS